VTETQTKTDPPKSPAKIYKSSYDLIE